MANDSLRSLSSLYITSCGIEGKSPETLRSYAETLKLFMRAVERLGLPNNPGLFRPADVYEFLGHVGSTGSLRNHPVEDGNERHGPSSPGSYATITSRPTRS